MLNFCIYRKSCILEVGMVVTSTKVSGYGVVRSAGIYWYEAYGIWEKEKVEGCLAKYIAEPTDPSLVLVGWTNAT